MLNYIFGNFFYYNRKSGDDNAVIMAWHSLSFFMAFNILSAFLYYCYFFDVPAFPKIVVIVIFLFTYILNYGVFMFNKRYLKVCNAYRENKTKFKDRFVVAYVALSIILTIIVVALMRSELMRGL